MLYVYHVRVGFQCPYPNHLVVRKDIVCCRVIKSGREYLYVCPWSENHGSSDVQKVPLKECFTSLLDAEREANRLGAQLADALDNGITELRGEAEVLDSTKGF